MLLALGMVLGLSGIQFDSDVSLSLRAQVTGDLAFVDSLQGTNQSPLHKEIFGNVGGSVYHQWFYQRVFFFGVDSCGSGGGAVACVKGDANKIWVTNNYINSDYPQIARLMTIFHEARHTEEANNNWPHAKCPLMFPYRSIWTGARLGGHAACDTTVYGSYSSATVMLNNISKFCSNCSDKVKADAAIYSDDQAKRVISSEAINTLAQDMRYE